MFKHVLIPTDGSELSGRAVQAGVGFAKSLGAKVTGLFAWSNIRSGVMVKSLSCRW